MSRIGIFCLPYSGHIHPLSGLAAELRRRGHEIVFFQLPDFESQVLARGFPCHVYGRSLCPPGTFPERLQHLSRLEGFDAMRASLENLSLQAEALFAEAPPIIAEANLDLWLVDQFDYAASSLAPALQSPFVTVIVTLMRQTEPGVPGFSGQSHSQDESTLQRDNEFNAAMLRASQPFRDRIGRFRLQSGLGPFDFDTLWSPLAQITQQPAAFEFPRRHLPACFHFTGPFALNSPAPSADFPWHKLSAKPLVYASFGTAQNAHLELYRVLLAAVDGLDIQLVLSQGGATHLDLPATLPPNVLTVPFAPQLEMLHRAALMVTHAGMNSTLECLAAGVPMVAVPISHDQPGVAARIAWSGAGLHIPAPNATPETLRNAIAQVLAEPNFRAAARGLSNTIRETNGLAKAASIVEQVLTTRQPVLRAVPPG